MLVPQDQIDLIAPIPQILSVGFGSLGGVFAIGALTILALLSIRIAQASVMFGSNTRLPMVAGWDSLLRHGSQNYMLNIERRWMCPSLDWVMLYRVALG